MTLLPHRFARPGGFLGATVVLAVILVAAPGGAQIDGPHTEISLLGGKIWPDELLDMDAASMFSLRAGYYPNARLGAELVADFAGSDRTSDPSLPYDYSFYGARAVVNLSPVELIAPYVFAGGGVTVLGLGFEDEPALTAHLGGGLKANVTRNLSFRGELRGLFTGFERFSIQNLHAGLGVSVSFGRDSDADGDGITDSHDLCPRTPSGSEVDWRGCPFDDDLDGVPNGLDQCPDTPYQSRVDSKGCETQVPTLRRRR